MVPEPYRPVLSRILCLDSPAGTSPWSPGLGPVRPVWTLAKFRRHVPAVRNPLYRAIANGTIPLDRSPILDVRQLTLSMVGTDPYWYSHLRGVYARYLPHGVRLSAMVTWGAPVVASRGRFMSHQHAHWHGSRWTSRAMGALWVWPALHPHSRWGISVDHWIDSYQTWFDPFLGYDAGVVLDTRMLALAGVPIPVPDPMADRLRPFVRCLSLADIPTPAMVTALDWPETSAPWLGDAAMHPATTARYSLARWLAFIEQFPGVPVYVPAAIHPAKIAPWLRVAAAAEPPCLPAGVVWPPPEKRHVSLRFPAPISRAMKAHRAMVASIRRRRVS